MWAGATLHNPGGGYGIHNADLTVTYIYYNNVPADGSWRLVPTKSIYYYNFLTYRGKVF